MLKSKRERDYESHKNKFSIKNLPITKYKDEILKKISKNKITIISGETGCGKSTQIPQFLLEKNPNSKILMTQPRRIAAISLQKRIKKELEEKKIINDKIKNKGLIGYQVGMDKEIYNNTQIFIKTTGIFLEELIHDELINYNFIIIDEVHERDVNIDLVLVIIRRILQRKDNIKIILMSATINVYSFYKYFQKFGSSENLIIEIKEKIYSVMEFYIENIENEFRKYNLSKKNFFENENEAYFSEELFEYVKYIIIDLFQKTNEENGILIFLPGLYEIKSLENYLNKELDKTINTNKGMINIKNYINIYILHSELKELQREVFKYIKGKRKIILATNIAESSITIPNITYVIDFCLTKEKNYDSINQTDFLKLNWCSKANLKQRAGRIGRISNGFVYRLIHKKFYEKLKETPKPEILRSSLDKIILKIKVYSNEEPYKILQECINCPNENEVNKSIKKLKFLGALSMTNNENLSGNLTYLGKIYAELPIDIQYSRLIILTSFFNLIDIGIIIASICSQEKKMFNSKLLKNRYELYQIKKESEFQNQNCDFICSYNIYWKWKRNFGVKMQSNEFDIYLNDLTIEDKREQEKFVKKYGLNLRVLIEILKTEADLKNRLYHFGKFFKSEKQIDFSDRENEIFFKFALMGTFYQNLIYAYFKNEKVNNRNYTKQNIETLKRTIEIKNIDNGDLNDITKCLNSIISPDKILQINNFNNSFSILVNDTDSIVKLYYISNNDEINLNIPGKNFNCKLSKYEFKVNFKIAFNNEDLIVDNESINYIIKESDNKSLQKYRFVTDKFITRKNRIYSNNICLLPDLKMFDELAIIIFSPDLIFESDINKKYYHSFKFKGNDYNDFFLSYYFGTGDLIKINKLRENLNKLTQLPLYIKKEDSNKKIIEEENEEFKLYQKLVCDNVEKLLKEKRIEIIRNKDKYDDLFKNFFNDFHEIDNFKNRNFIIEQFKNLKYDPKDFLKPLKPIENINEDFRIATEEGKKNLLEQNNKYKEIVNKLEKKFNQAKLIKNGDYSINLYCKLCNDFICSGDDIIKNNNYNINYNINHNNINRNVKINFPKNWEMNIKIYNSDNKICLESDFVKECNNENIIVDYFISCKNNHIFGGKYLENYFITCFSNLYIKDFDDNKEDFDYSYINNNFQKLKNKINYTKERIYKEKNSKFYCDLCDLYCNNVIEFDKHLKDSTHKYYFDELKNDLQ